MEKFRVFTNFELGTSIILEKLYKIVSLIRKIDVPSRASRDKTSQVVYTNGESWMKYLVVRAVR